MQTLRHARFLARFVLAWFVLSLGVALAAPVVKPQQVELVCAGAGIKLLVKADAGAADESSHTLDCPLCVHLAWPPAAVRPALAPAQPLSHAVGARQCAHIAWITGPPPARGPPA